MVSGPPVFLSLNYSLNCGTRGIVVNVLIRAWLLLSTLWFLLCSFSYWLGSSPGHLDNDGVLIGLVPFVLGIVCHYSWRFITTGSVVTRKLTVYRD